METQTNPQPPPVGDRPLRRSSSDRVLAGVAGGIAARLDIPAWVVRVAFVVLAFAGGLGVALYIAGWILIPEDGDSEPIASGLTRRIQDGSGWMGIALIGIGVIIAASSIDFIRGDLAVAVFIGVVGVLLYRGELGGGSKSTSTDDTASTPEPTGTSSASLANFDHQEGTVPPPPPSQVAPPQTEPPKPPEPTRPPSILGRLTIALALIASGVMAFLDYAVTSFDPTPRHYLGLVVGILGVGLVVGSVIGRARGLIFVGILLAPLLIFSPLAEFELNSGIGQRRVAPTSVSEIAPSYELAIGELVVDLRDVDFSGETVNLETSVGIGSLRVLVPSNVAVEVDAEVGIGEAQAFGVVRSGLARSLEVSQEGAGTLVLDAQTLIGEVRITNSNADPASAGAARSTDVIDLVITTPAELDNSYELHTGEIRLDLSNLVLRTPRTVSISNGVGRVEVIVPSRETTSVNAEVAIGRVDLFGVEQGGFRTSVNTQASGRALLTLDIEVNSGEIVVEEG